MKVCYRLPAAKEELAKLAGGEMFINCYFLCQDSVTSPNITIQVDKEDLTTQHLGKFT